MNIKYDYYMKSYAEHIRDAFQGFWRRGLWNKLMHAIDLYNGDKFEPAINILLQLRKKCKTVNEHCAVLTFIALCYDEMHYFAPCIEAYREILSLDPTRSSIQSNLGLMYRRTGEYDKAVLTFLKALEYDPENPYALNNLGLTYYRMGEYDGAISCCEKALAIKGNFYQAANCLCLCYFALRNREECQKYYKIAVTNGADPKTLKAEIKKLREGMMVEDHNDLWWDL